jgi:hypothetical protein
LEGHAALLLPARSWTRGSFEFGLLPLEHGPERDAACTPKIDAGGVVPGAQQQVRRAVPDGHDDLVRAVEGLKGPSVDPSEAEVADLDIALVRDEDVGGFEVAVDDPVVVQVGDAVEELPEQCLEDGNGDGCAVCGVVVDDLLSEAFSGMLESTELNLPESHALRIRKSCRWICPPAGPLSRLPSYRGGVLD